MIPGRRLSVLFVTAEPFVCPQCGAQATGLAEEAPFSRRPVKKFFACGRCALRTLATRRGPYSWIRSRKAYFAK